MSDKIRSTIRIKTGLKAGQRIEGTPGKPPNRGAKEWLGLAWSYVVGAVNYVSPPGNAPPQPTVVSGVRG